MTYQQEEFIKSFLDIAKKLEREGFDLNTVLEFCNIFRCSDIDLFKKFESSMKNFGFHDSFIDMDTIVDLYAEKYELDKDKDAEKIMYFFIDNAINGGMNYHITNSASISSIFKSGLGVNTEERKDFLELKKLAGSKKALSKLAPYDDSTHICYSEIPNADALRYGKMPEWIQEVAVNLETVKEFKDEFDDVKINDEMLEKAEEIVQKYNKKYYKMGRELLILPRLNLMITEDDIEELLEQGTPKKIMSYFYNHCRDNDARYYGVRTIDKKSPAFESIKTGKVSTISPNYIIGIDLDTFNVHFLGEDGTMKTKSPYEEIEIQIPSSYSMEEVWIGNTGKMYQLDDNVDGGEYYFKPAITKRGENAPYKAHVQEAAYRLQKIINPDNAVKCNIINIEGTFGAIQEKIPIDEQKTKAFRRYFNCEEGQLSPEIISQILDEYLVDFCLCNYDSHARNFIIDVNGKLRGIDKEQSFKYLNEDEDGDMKFSTNYNVGYGESPSIYNILFEQMEQGKISCQYLDSLREKASLVEQIPSFQYVRYFKPYVARLTSDYNEKSELLMKIKDRRVGLKEKVEQLITEITQEAKKNKSIQPNDETRGKITMKDALANAIKSETTLADINNGFKETKYLGENVK